MHILRIALTALAISFSAPAIAQEIDGDQIPKTIGDKTVTLMTLGFKFPLYYSTSGFVTGDGNAVGLAKYFNPKETGKWWVEKDQLCQKFPTWYKGKTFCFALSSTGKNRIKWVRSDGFSGKAVISG